MRTGTQPNTFARRLFSGLPARYDVLAEVLSFRQNARWRRTMVDRVVASGPAAVLDVATGTAGVARQLAQRTSASVTGVDLTEPMLRRAAAAVDEEGHRDRIRLAVARAEQLPFADATFDALTFTYLMRYVADPDATLRELVRVVRPGGVIASLEFHVPPTPVWHALWWLYTRVGLPTVGSLAGRSWYEVGRFLGPSISRHYRRYPLIRTLTAWRDAGIVDVGYRVMSLGGGVVIWGVRAHDRP
ncbi:MAG TPA: class I SAM-dependent methyltransferase [Nitriliruptorales bacterium]|nr:class I SAM-dependent methyltransferase [Nitriliruptorales bacterium]